MAAGTGVTAASWLVGDATRDLPWWRLVIAWLVCCSVATVVLGSGRELVRGYREPR